MSLLEFVPEPPLHVILIHTCFEKFWIRNRFFRNLRNWPFLGGGCVVAQIGHETAQSVFDLPLPLSGAHRAKFSDREQIGGNAGQQRLLHFFIVIHDQSLNFLFHENSLDVRFILFILELFAGSECHNT